MLDIVHLVDLIIYDIMQKIPQFLKKYNNCVVEVVKLQQKLYEGTQFYVFRPERSRLWRYFGLGLFVVFG